MFEAEPRPNFGKVDHKEHMWRTFKGLPCDCGSCQSSARLNLPRQDVSSVLSMDDECHTGASCTMQALQLRGELDAVAELNCCSMLQPLSRGVYFCVEQNVDRFLAGLKGNQVAHVFPRIGWIGSDRL